MFLSIAVATPFAAAPSRRKPGGARPGRDWPVAGQWRMRGQPGANQTWRIAYAVPAPQVQQGFGRPTGVHRSSLHR